MMWGLRLMMWVWVRGIGSGAVAGALLGTLLMPIAGTLLGAGYGLMIGAIFGFVNGATLAIMTSLFFARGYQRGRFIAWVMLATIPFDVVAVVLLLGNQLGNVTAVLMALTAGYYSFGYVDYVGRALVETRKSVVKVLS
ncbi:MAG: hypothetical protein LCI00_14375 [Chloroflexi bacterium]|nr:hypothetical protein [Chloroflexota bacterium]MCC6895100.1 hypothetical protein [Anaerolineae bacterium]